MKDWRYTSAVSNRMRKIDLIDRLKKNEPCNTAHYQRQLEQQLVQHDDVIHRLTDIMKTDNYFRRTEDLPMIDPPVAFEEVEQFPELFDTKEAVLEQQLVQHDDVIHRLMDIMKTDNYFRRTEDLPMIDPTVAFEEVEQFPELFDTKEAVSRISTEVNIIERWMR